MIMLTIKHVPVTYPIAKLFFIDTESSYHHIFIKANGLSKDQDQCLKG